MKNGIKKEPVFLQERRDFLKKFPLNTLKTLYDTTNYWDHDKATFKEIINKEVKTYSYQQLANEMNAIGTSLMDMGFEGAHIAVLGENSYGWLRSYVTTVLMGTIVTIDKELTTVEMNTLTAKADCSAIFVSDTYLDRAREIRKLNSNIKELFIWGNITEDELLENEWSCQYLLEKGEKLLEEGENSYLIREVKPNDVAAIVFTSGTTGLNKGVMLTHKNICSNIKAVAEGFPPFELPYMSVLPMTHTYEMNCAILVGLYFGRDLVFNRSLKNLLKDIQTLKPGMMLVVPMFLEKFYHSIWNNARKSGRDKELKKALKVSNISRKFGIDLRERLFKDIFEIFGGNLRFFVCGGAAMNEDIAKGLTDFGFRILQGYGITECSPLVAFNYDKEVRNTSVGLPAPGTKIKISDPDVFGVGEVLVKSDGCTIGYYKDQESTEKVFSDGWYCTGDYGYLDRKGNLWLCGRKKNLIILENGKNVFPEELEMEISKVLPDAEDIVVYEETMEINGHKHQYITAAISIREETELALLTKDERNTLILQTLRKLNSNLAGYKRIGMFFATTEAFQKNAAKKIVRRNLKKNKKDYIMV